MTLPDERQLLFRRLAAAAEKQPCATAPDPASAPTPGEGLPAPVGEEGRIARFAKALAEAGGALFTGPAEALLHDLGEALRAEGVTALFAPEGDEGARRVAEALAPFGPFSLTSCAEVRGGGNPAATAGFRTAEAGIAETGTVVETNRLRKTLLPGLLADVHVSLLPAYSLFGSMGEALEAFRADPPRNISFITGPSRSADIEQTFTAGVFGPVKTIVLLL